MCAQEPHICASGSGLVSSGSCGGSQVPSMDSPHSGHWMTAISGSGIADSVGQGFPDRVGEVRLAHRHPDVGVLHALEQVELVRSGQVDTPAEPVRPVNLGDKLLNLQLRMEHALTLPILFTEVKRYISRRGPGVPFTPEPRP